MTTQPKRWNGQTFKQCVTRATTPNRGVRRIINEPRSPMRLNEGKQNQLNFREMKQTEIQEMITLKNTAMQEMIAYFELFKGKDKSNQAMPLGIAISIAKSLLEQEKEQIMDAYDEGWSDGFDDKDLNAEYYNETFNANEK
jgi:hypothetical protein